MLLSSVLLRLLQVRMNGHTGYVRSLATSGKYLFSCGCNYLRQWDQAYAVPKEVSSTKLFKGDILSIACGDKRVFTAGADGVLRSWNMGKTGELTEAAVREKAHDGRITSILVNGSLLYSAGYDGTIKVGSGLLLAGRLCTAYGAGLQLCTIHVTCACLGAAAQRSTPLYSGPFSLNMWCV